MVDLINFVCLEFSFLFRTLLTPNLKCYTYIFIHDSNFF
ncbi:hypothetical protein EVA_15209 [gut metagenome]|uniref:Uncharacterized protein n=1 Tax=gut metagenome TaxID=749906 RepID=J9GB83_9ZZZZ